MLKKIVLISMMSLPGLSLSNEVGHTSLLTTDNEVQLAGILDINANYQVNEDNTGHFPNVSMVMPRSNQGSEALIGTWYFTYYYKSPHTDALVINQSEGEGDQTLAKGAYFLDRDTDNGVTIACQDSDESIYYCFAKPSEDQFFAFIFTFTNNIISSGFFGVGPTIARAEKVALNKRYPIVGFREPSTSPGPIYHDDTGELDLPSVEYQKKFYRVTLKDEGGFKFAIKDVAPLK